MTLLKRRVPKRGTPEWDEYIRLYGLPPMAGGAPDEDDPDDADDESPDDADDSDEPADEPDDDEDEDLASDADTKAWLEDIVKIPEIRSVIRQAATQIADKATASTSEVREEIEEMVNRRVDKIKGELKDLSKPEATERVREEVEPAAERVSQRHEEDDDPAETDAAKARRKRRELDVYRREALLDEDASKMVPELINVDQADSESDIDDMIETAKDTYSRIRQQVVRELRNKGWKSPKQLEPAEPAPAPTPRPAPVDDDEDVPGPPSRDRRSQGAMSTREKNELRDRFGYAEPEAEPVGRRGRR